MYKLMKMKKKDKFLMYLLIKVKKNPKDKEKFLKILKIISIWTYSEAVTKTDKVKWTEVTNEEKTKEIN